MTAVVHIGPHKTGSTTIQLSLRSVSAWLAGHGFELPPLEVADQPGTAAVNHLALEMMGCRSHPWHAWDVAEGRETAVVDWLRACTLTPILSAEEFSRFDDVLIDRLACLVPAGALCVIVARPYDSLSSSIWAQLVSAGVEVRSLGAFQRDYRKALLSELRPQRTDRAQVDLQRTRLTHLADSWSRRFHVRLLAPAWEGHEGAPRLVGSFLYSIGIPDTDIAGAIDGEGEGFRELRANPRLPSERLLRILALNRRVGTGGPRRWADERDAIRASNRPLPLEPSPDLVPDAEASRELRGLYLRDTSALRGAFAG